MHQQQQPVCGWPKASQAIFAQCRRPIVWATAAAPYFSSSLSLFCLFVCRTMSEFSACFFWGWLANLEKCQPHSIKKAKKMAKKKPSKWNKGDNGQTVGADNLKNKQANAAEAQQMQMQHSARAGERYTRERGREIVRVGAHLLLPVLVAVVRVRVRVRVRVLSLFIYAQNVSFSFGQGSRSLLLLLLLAKTWKLGYWRLFRATRSCHAISIFVVGDNQMLSNCWRRKTLNENKIQPTKEKKETEIETSPTNWQLGI